ncbi:MAG: hypothetical protein IKW96_11910 [Ruminococcus sp.]|uniref:hypothetical protein n=1 Tax=Ruminococcus sp. TaxID=41978 RepID=UPI0025D7CD0E|nr:hypothetical protein [Ruminococcus sp.]MBR5683959.1 hypothetical protein [Ruminococcus sp.]
MKKIILKLSAPLLAAAVLVSCGRADIDLNNYLRLSFSGLDTAASADIDMDYEKIVTDNLRAFGIKDPDDRESIQRAAEKLAECISGSPDKDSMLSNGDVITFRWDRSGVEELENTYKIRLALSDKEITVCDLREAERFDPFDFLNLEYSGVEPNGELILNADGLPVKNVSFTARHTSGLSNGDRIKVRFGGASEKETTEKCFGQGFVPECFEKAYTVSGVPVYVKKLGDISKASYERMDGYAQEELRKLGASWADKKLCDVELLGAELYTPAENTAKWGRNALCYVYRVTSDIKSGSDAKKHGENLDYYYFTYFLNVFTPDNSKNGEFPAEKAVFPSYSQFYDSFYGDAFKVGDVICEGCKSLDELRQTMADCFEGSICETNIEEE